MKRVAVFGMGYVGCVTAACLCRDGHHVVGVDVDESKIATILAGLSPVSEPGLEDLIRAGIDAGNLTATTDLADAVLNSDVALIAVGTPSRPDGDVDCTAVERVVAEIGRVLADESKEYTVAVRSTLLPGILEERLAPALEEAAGTALGGRIHLCNNPEFLREATAIRDYDDPPFVLVGAPSTAEAQPVLDLYEKCPARQIVADTRTASLVKYACNAFHALKIDFANEIGVLAKEFGADGQSVMNIVCQDTRLNISPAYLKPGFAFGGSCLPKDVRALTRFGQRNAIETHVLNAILPSNQAHLERALSLIRSFPTKRIGLVGLSFKADTDDLRESPQVILAETLLGRGCDLKIYDPKVRLGGLRGQNLAFVDQHLPHLAALLVDDPSELYAHAELLILATDVANDCALPADWQGDTIDLRRDLVVPGNVPAPVR